MLYSINLRCWREDVGALVGDGGGEERRAAVKNVEALVGDGGGGQRRGRAQW